MKPINILMIFAFAAVLVLTFLGIQHGFSMLDKKSDADNIYGLFAVLVSVVASYIAINFIVKKINKSK